ncbi:DUF2752 domain-containing protein [Flavobacterium sp. NG2]|uniref:DUF2752 domain-containing protein n=1 Tax=Flavobacterium sp. NG2 TaxID=3097547 RepID=UPI002A7EBE14|nr:DUF2752 domain-containing protein [Flavobacterium sp. NG2]WPR70281.1 DUF2752 domain-containing protein [Flavobacterium sp. NG2]
MECLGCGFQRSFLLLAQGNFQAAFEMYPAIFTTILFLVFISFQYLYKKTVSQKTIQLLFWTQLLFMIIGYGYKNYFLLSS